MSAATPIDAATLEISLSRSINLGAVPAAQATRYGLVVHRADLRTFPTNLRVFRSQDDADIDRFQESALFPGTPVVDRARERRWQVVVRRESRSTPPGSSSRTSPRVRGRKCSPTQTRRHTWSSQARRLERCTRANGLKCRSCNWRWACACRSWPTGRRTNPVNGQHPYTAYVIELPWRTVHGTLRFTPALLPKTADVASDYLPLTRGEPVAAELQVPGRALRLGTRLQRARLQRLRFRGVPKLRRSDAAQYTRPGREPCAAAHHVRRRGSEGASTCSRCATLQVGDLIYIPGHVMMVIGHERGTPVRHSRYDGDQLSRFGRRSSARSP